jgi:hypothetical protein
MDADNRDRGVTVQAAAQALVIGGLVALTVRVLLAGRRVD